MTCYFCGAEIQTPFCGFCGNKQNPVTLAQLYEDWKKVHYRRIGENGRKGYENSWRILSVLGAKPVISITLDDYQVVMDSIAYKSCALQQKLRQLISQLCQYAALCKIDQSNYAPFLILDGYKSKSRVIFSDSEITRLISFAQTNFDRAGLDARIVLILIFTGLRPEELFAIQKTDVHLAEKYITVAGSKTTAGRNRVIPISPLIARYLFLFLFQERECPFLITSPQGCRMNLHNWRKRFFFPLMCRLEINPPDDPHRIVPYCARHTYASLAKRAGVDPGILCKWIGHADPKTTERFYIHETMREMEVEEQKITHLAYSFFKASGVA